MQYIEHLRRNLAVMKLFIRDAIDTVIIDKEAQLGRLETFEIILDKIAEMNVPNEYSADILNPLLNSNAWMWRKTAVVDLGKDDKKE
jgi:hypothetical protein